MEDILYYILVIAVMVGGAISSANKKKKEKADAARKVQQQQPHIEDDMPERKFVRKSLSEVLEELANREESFPSPAPDIIESDDDYFTYETASAEEMTRASERLRRMTYTSPDEKKIQAPSPSPVSQVESTEKSSDSLKDILGGEFDLRRAVIESEILKPKYEQY